MAATHTHSQPGAAIKPVLISIPEGWFLMGSASGQDCERPIHRVWIDAFHLAATQVTNAEYAVFLRDTQCDPPPFWQDPNFNHPQQPVTGVSWFDSDHYCRWLTEKTGRPYRLPTEAEWERAARADLEQSDFPWVNNNKSNDPPQSLPDYATRWQTGPEPVAQYAPNNFGLYNLCDNVHEWCSDWYDPNYYAVSPEQNPRGPELRAGLSHRKASRGGSWRHHIKVSRCSARSSIPPDFHYADYGFRVACNIWSNDAQMSSTGGKPVCTLVCRRPRNQSRLINLRVGSVAMSKTHLANRQNPTGLESGGESARVRKPRQRTCAWFASAFLIGGLLGFSCPVRAQTSSDYVTVSGTLTGCGGASGGVLYETGMAAASGSAVQSGGAVSGSGNLPGGGMGVSESSSSGCSGSVSTTLSIHGTVFLPAGVAAANIALHDTTFNFSDNCADLVGGCGNEGGDPLAQLSFWEVIEDLNDFRETVYLLLESILGEGIGVLDPAGVVIQVPANPDGTPILIQSGVWESVANGVNMKVKDPLVLVLPPGATFVPDNPSISFPTVTVTTMEPLIYAIFATANGCSSINVSSGSVDSFNSSQGPYSSSHSNAGGDVATNGNVTLSGASTIIYGTAASPFAGTGNCSPTSVTGYTPSGGATATVGQAQLSGPETYPAPPAPNPPPPTVSQKISGSCGSVPGCTNDGSNTVTLAPGPYGNLSITGGTTAHVSEGTYNINSLTLSDKSILYVDSGPVIVNLAGALLSGGNPAMHLSGGSMSNSGGLAKKLQFYYAGSQPLEFSGGESYAVIYLPIRRSAFPAVPISMEPSSGALSLSAAAPQFITTEA